MIKEALEYLVKLGPPTQVKDGTDRVWVDRQLNPVHPSLPKPVITNTLDGFIGLLDNEIEAYPITGVLVHVETFKRVALLAKASDTWGRQQVYAAAELLDVKGFPFGSWLEHEAFVIGLQANFVMTPDLATLVRIASNITSDMVVTSQDDGISQQVGLKRGVVLKEQETLPQRVKLSPYRTFREVEQPISEFVFRVHQKEAGAVPTLALIEADGGAWQLDAMKTVGEYLKARTKIPVIV